MFPGRRTPWDTFSPLYNIYKCADGHWVSICGNGWPWRKFVHRAGWDESWYTNYPGNDRRLYERPQALRGDGALDSTKNYDEVDAILSDCDIPHDVCQSYREVAQDNVAMEADLMQEISYPRSGSTVRIPRSPIHFHEAGLPETTHGGVPGEDTMDVLTSYGYSEEEIRAHRRAEDRRPGRHLDPRLPGCQALNSINNTRQTVSRLPLFCPKTAVCTAV